MNVLYKRDIYWWCLSMTTFLVFLILKLIGIIAWKWIWIFSPLWLPLIWIGFIITVIVLIFNLRLKLLERCWKLERRKQ